jgi:hypothetical protein
MAGLLSDMSKPDSKTHGEEDIWIGLFTVSAAGRRPVARGSLERARGSFQGAAG